MKRLLNEPIQFFVGDVIRLKKPHACGGFDWSVHRLGLDIGLQCTTCRRRIMLPRLETERRFRLFVERGDPSTAIPILRPEMAETGDDQ
ncbi:MAG TPA: DUF951 domain-containing protein [Thermomicrobiales bacterium]|nr:DUF951 domain-containing protein [Thermomicrobiales bacterium]HRA47758.1 DUF951 domain-containing protein [Thermomicrobiales bacterium]